jgi:hypothetical protein
MTRHLQHLLMLAVPLAVFCALFLREWRRTAGAALPRSLRLLVTGAVGAAVVHGVVVPRHVEEAAVLGWFFTLLALGQLTWGGLVLLLPRRQVVAAGVVVNAGVVVLWAWTRVVSVPFGLGAREQVGLADLVATGCELLVVAAGAVWLQRDGRLALARAGSLVEVRQVDDEEEPAAAERQHA